MARRLKLGEELIWRGLSLEAIETQPECFVTTAEEERSIPLAWFRTEISRRYVLTAGDDEGLAVLKVVNGLGTVSSMFVRPNARRSGLADRLLGSAYEYAKSAGCLSMTLQVFEDNAAAIGLYQKHSFEVECTELFGDRIDCRMVAKLDGS